MREIEQTVRSNVDACSLFITMFFLQQGIVSPGVTTLFNWIVSIEREGTNIIERARPSIGGTRRDLSQRYNFSGHENPDDKIGFLNILSRGLIYTT